MSNDHKDLASNNPDTRPVIGINDPPSEEGQTIPQEDMQTIPVEGEQTASAEGTHTVLMEDEQTASAEGTHTVLMEDEQTASAEGTHTVLMEDEQTASVEGTHTVRMEGEQTAPVEGQPTVPTEGEQAAPVEGQPTVPTEGKQAAPVAGEQTAPVTGEEPAPAVTPVRPRPQQRKNIDLSGNITKPLLLFLIPLMLSNALQSISGTVTSIYLGRGLGEKALAAVSTVFPITFFLISFIIGIGGASSVLIGQAYGSGNVERMKATVGTSLTFSFLLGLLSAVIGNVFAYDLFALIRTPQEIVEEAVGFARIIFTFLPIMFVYISYTTFLRGTGDSKTPFYFLLISTVLTIGLTPIFLFGWFGLPVLGVEGAAVANVTATIVTLIVLFVYLVRKKHPLALDKETLKKLRLDREIVKLMLKIGIPTSVQMIFVSLSEVAVLALINAYGAEATAAYGAVIQVINYAQMPAMSLGMAVGIFGAQMIGSGRQEKLQELIRSAVVLNYAIGAIIVGTVFVFSTTILSWFLTDPHTLAMAHDILFISLWAFIIFGHAMIISGIMRSSGTVLWPTTIGILSIWVVQVPTAYLLSKAIGLTGIWMAYPIAFTVSLIAQYTYYRLFWRGRTHRQFFDSPAPENG